VASSHRSELPSAGITHPMVREYLQIKRNRPGNQAGAVALEGLWAIRHAVDASVPIEAVFVCNTLVRGEDTDAVLAELLSVGVVALQVVTVPTDLPRSRVCDRTGWNTLPSVTRLSL
jgi:hypothetical protein